MTDGENTLHNKPISLLPPIRIREYQRKHEARGIKTFMDAFVVTDPDARSDPAQLAMSVGMEEHNPPGGHPAVNCLELVDQSLRQPLCLIRETV